VVETQWYMRSLKKEERQQAAARLIQRLLESSSSSVRSLMYKLDPDDYDTEESVEKLLRFLETSPMGKQPLPDAGLKIGNYYRKLSRKRAETVPEFLIREDSTHDEMWRALQRLLREREIDFEGYEVTKEELQRFVGLDEEERHEEAEIVDDEVVSGGSLFQGTQKGSGKGRRPVAPRHKQKDLLTRLLDKGLIPLAAWMVLEVAGFDEKEKNLVKASTQNQLDYNRVRAALLAQWDERSHHKGHMKGNYWTDSYNEYPNMEPAWDENSGYWQENGEYGECNTYDWPEDEIHCRTRSRMTCYSSRQHRISTRLRSTIRPSKL
jgi:hypothetical protein